MLKRCVNNIHWPIFRNLRAFQHCLQTCPIRRKSFGGAMSEKLLEAFRACLFTKLERQEVAKGNKVSIVGAGAVGMACANALVAKGITNNLAIYDIDEELCSARRMELMQGTMFLNSCHINGGCNAAATADSRVVVVAAGASGKCGEGSVQKSANIIKEIMPCLVQNSPKAIFIILTQPADTMTWLAQKVSKLPMQRCFSTGCHLDTTRLRIFIADSVKLSTDDVSGYVVGEQGKSSLPMWSTVAVGGMPLHKIDATIGTDNDTMNWPQVFRDQRDHGGCYSSWAVGLTVADVIGAIFEDSHRIISLSTNASGMCGIEHDVFLSMPCVVNKSGICAKCRLHLSKAEACALLESANRLLERQCSIQI